jgi:hypothetical protein
MKTEFNYVILRYVHDVVSGEFANVGIVLVAPKIRFAGALCTERYQRISQFFLGASGKHVRDVNSFMQGRIEELSEQMTLNSRQSEFPRNAVELIQQVLPKDDSSFQVSELRGGLADGSRMDDTLRDLFDRFVEKYERIQERHTRTDEDIWRPFKRALDVKRVSAHLKPYLLKSRHCEFEFKRVFKNGRLHVCQPISFDLGSEKEVSEKALLWFGRIEQLREDSEPFKAYFLLGKPTDPTLAPAFKDAEEILQEVQTEKEVYTEDSVERFAEQVQNELRSAHW